MISTLTGVSTPLGPRSVAGQERPQTARPGATLPSVSETKKAAQAQRKAMAQQRLSAVMERMQALKLMIRLDARAALRMTAELAKELQAAVKAYSEAGGRNVSTGDLAMIRKQAVDARNAEMAEAEAATAPGVDAEVKRAHEAYAATSGRWLDDLAGIESRAIEDYGFFDRVKSAVAGLKEARVKIRGEAGLQLRGPDEDDWKASDQAMTELEREIDAAAGGPLRA